MGKSSILRFSILKEIWSHVSLISLTPSSLIRVSRDNVSEPIRKEYITHMNVFEEAEKRLSRKDLRLLFRRWYMQSFTRLERNWFNWKAEQLSHLHLRQLISYLHQRFIRDTFPSNKSPNISSLGSVPIEVIVVSHRSVYQTLVRIESLSPFLSMN